MTPEKRTPPGKGYPDLRAIANEKAKSAPAAVEEEAPRAGTSPMQWALRIALVSLAALLVAIFLSSKSQDIALALKPGIPKAPITAAMPWVIANLEVYENADLLENLDLLKDMNELEKFIKAPIK